MPRCYRHIKEYEKIFELKEKGYTKKEIAEMFVMSKEQIQEFIKRHNRNQRKLEAGIPSKKRGRPAKDYLVNVK